MRLLSRLRQFFESFSIVKKRERVVKKEKRASYPERREMAYELDGVRFRVVVKCSNKEVAAKVESTFTSYLQSLKK